MPPHACQLISYYPSSSLPYSIPRAPSLWCTKEPRLKHRCSEPLRSILQTNWCETLSKRWGGNNNNKQQQKQQWRGRWWAYLSSFHSPTFCFCWSRRFHQGVNWETGRGEMCWAINWQLKFKLCLWLCLCILFPHVNFLCPNFSSLMTSKSSSPHLLPLIPINVVSCQHSTWQQPGGVFFFRRAW